MNIYTRKNIFFIFVCIFITLFFTTFILAPRTVLGTTTDDSVNITFTVTEAVATPGTGGGGKLGTPTTLAFFDVDVIPDTYSATVMWTTNRSVASTFAWGTTTEYTLGVLSEASDSYDHSTFLDSLIPETLYYFAIDADDPHTGPQRYVGNFRTLALPDVVPPTNVSDFVAIAQEEKIGLMWENPLDEDFENVRVVRSENFFPLTPYDGIVVYEGRGTDAVDTRVRKGVTYYYSVFAIDENGNASEGSIDSARIALPGEPADIGDPFATFPSVPRGDIDPLIDIFSLLQIDFIQDGKKIPYVNLDRVPIDSDKELTISVDYDVLPEILKTIGVTVTDPDDHTKTFSFLLRVTDDKQTYRTTLAPFGRGGVYSFDVHILDHKNQGLKRLEGKMLMASIVGEGDTLQMFWKLIKTILTDYTTLILWIILIVLLLIVWASREKIKKYI